MLPPILLPPSALSKHNPNLKISYFRHRGHTDKNNWGLGEWTSEDCTQLMHTHERSLTTTLDVRKLYTTNASTWKVSNQSLEQRLCLGEQFIRSAENWHLQLTAIFLKTQNVARGYLFKGGLSAGAGASEGAPGCKYYSCLAAQPSSLPSKREPHVCIPTIIP